VAQAATSCLGRGNFLDEELKKKRKRIASRRSLRAGRDDGGERKRRSIASRRSFDFAQDDRKGRKAVVAAQAGRLAASILGLGRPCHWNRIGEKTKRFAAVVRVRCAAPLPLRSFGARRPPLGQGEVIRTAFFHGRGRLCQLELGRVLQRVRIRLSLLPVHHFWVWAGGF
jgi:hypothetical protein